MHRGVALTQAQTLREWSDQWSHEATTGPAEGFSDVALLMERAARQIERTIGGGPSIEELKRAEEEPELRMPEPITDTRPDMEDASAL